MKQRWSNNWISSKQPRKQRKYKYNAPMHIRQKFVSSHLTPALRKQFKTRSVSLRKGDEVKVMMGSFKGKSGNVERINLKRIQIFIDSIKVKKVNGSEVMKPFEPSNLMITKLNLDDKMRQKILNRKGVKSEVKHKEVKEAKAKTLVKEHKTEAKTETKTESKIVKTKK